MEKNSVTEVLATYTAISFLLVVPQVKNAGGMEAKFYFLIAIKSFCMFLAWLCGFYSLKKIPVSLFGVISLSRVLFATLSGVIFLKESMEFLQIAGLFLVCGGLLLLKFNPLEALKSGKTKTKKSDLCATEKSVPISEKIPEKKSLLNLQINSEEKTASIFVILAFFSCVMNSFSGFMDKILMKDLNSSQLQFWYMFFITIYYAIYVFVKKEKISISVLKNKWVWILAIMFVIGDKALFIANGNPQSKITVMTLLKQVACVATIIGGKFIFKEKQIGYKLFCASVVIAGIVLGAI